MHFRTPCFLVRRFCLYRALTSCNRPLQAVNEILSADFEASGYVVTRVRLLGTAVDSGGTSENIFLNGPCPAILHGDGAGVVCSPTGDEFRYSQRHAGYTK